MPLIHDQFRAVIRATYNPPAHLLERFEIVARPEVVGPAWTRTSTAMRLPSRAHRI